MKKLSLVTLMAVAASWLLSEAPGPVPPKSASLPPIAHRIEAPRPPEPPSPPESIRTVPWRKAAADRIKRVSRGTSTRPAPSWFPTSEIEEEAKARPDADGSRVLVGRVSISEERAQQDLRATLEREVSDWLAADVPPTWHPPVNAINAMRQDSFVQKVARALTTAAPALPGAAPAPSALDEFYTLYRAGQKLDFSPSRRAWLVEMYRHDLATRRMQRLGGGLALALACLGLLAGYIRADEATRGYYTNRLRLAAAAGLGVAGVAAYRILA